MDDKDYILLNWLSTFKEPTEVREEKAPHDVKVNLEFYGLDKQKFPDSIWVRLHELERFKLVNSLGKKHEITDAGRLELQKVQDNKTQEKFVSEMQFEKLNLEVEDLRNKFFDYPEVKQRTKTTARSTVVAVVVSVLSLIVSMLSLLCNKSG